MLKEHHLTISIVGFSSIACYYLWKYFSKTAMKLMEAEHLYEKYKLDYAKHNSIVMYSPSIAKGWPGWPENCIDKRACGSNSIILEPILYFIKTAKDSLDIAMMMITVNEIVDEIISAKNRGVHIRVIIDAERMRSSPLKNLMELHRINIGCYKYPKPTNRIISASIFHYKFMIKDWTTNSGFAQVGSMNYTLTGFIYNYENLVFTTNKNFVNNLHHNFEEAWEMFITLCPEVLPSQSFLHPKMMIRYSCWL